MREELARGFYLLLITVYCKGVLAELVLILAENSVFSL
jgi:hypothetical protein